MDLNKRDELIEKRNKLNKSLKSTYATLLKENWNMAKEAEEEVAPLDVDSPETAPVDAGMPPVDAPVDPAADAPVSDEQSKMATTDFATKYLKTLPTDVDMESSVNEQGIFNASVNDDQNGQYMVVVFPATKNIREVADILSPVDPAAPVDGEALPPVSDVPPVDAAMPPVDAPVDEVKEAACETEDCDDREQMYAEMERSRDPVSSGRKDWKAMQESAKKKLNESDEAKLKKSIETAEKLLAAETDDEEKAALKKDIAKMKAKLSAKKISDTAIAANKVKSYNPDAE